MNDIPEQSDELCPRCSERLYRNGSTVGALINLPDGTLIHGHCMGSSDYSQAPAADNVNHPSHYTNVVPGIECIDVTEHFSFTRGNAIKYLWRAGAKGDLVEDLRKAIWYIQREIDGQAAS